MASTFTMYAIRNVQTGKFVSYMSDDGTQYVETDIYGNYADFESELQANEYLKRKIKCINSVCYFEVVKML